MADKHSTGNSRPSKIPAERRLTVGTQFYEYPPTESGASRRSRRVPWLQMRGDWLSAAGFEIRAPVKVRVMRGCLVVTVVEED
ncbi:SymE family type I addiction module toxin [Endothiovibrio diazotrophicus]